MNSRPRGERIDRITPLRPRLPSGGRDPISSARAAGLRYTTDTTPGIRRLGRPGRFRYRTAAGRPIRSAAELRRIRALVIPPAWTDVWICPDPRGHLQATGRDARGRKQYRYHPRWRAVRDETKYDRLIGFAHALPALRRRTSDDLRATSLTREKVLALVVRLLEKTLIRVGNDEYARTNRSFGLTTLKDGHVDVDGGRVRFSFRGKSGVEHDIDLADRRLARIVNACRDIPGYDLFQYYDEQGRRHAIGSADVNGYLKAVTGSDYTSKDFRTWAGTVLAAEILRDLGCCDSERQAKRRVVQAVEAVAGRLGNTRTVCRKCYIHPAVLASYFAGATIPPARPAPRSLHALSASESAVLALLRRAAAESRRRAS
jgi:DNA topoisomerase I